MGDKAKKSKSPKELILQVLKEKSCLKQDVYRNTLEQFEVLKSVLKELAEELKSEMSCVDERIKVEYIDKSTFEVHLVLAGDILIFSMHSNVFLLDSSDPLWQTSYLKEDDKRAFCGTINIYNFLADSFKYSRNNDLGYLIARIFINHENHFFVQGKRQLGFLYNDFLHAVMDKKAVESLLESAILYSLDFDLLTPPYDAVKEISVSEILELGYDMHPTTGKRLGFKFQADSDAV
jgi:hypothetical protein